MFVNNILPRSKPEEQGVSSKAISDFLDAIEDKKLELHSFMLLRHQNVIAEGWWSPYKPELKHMLYSLSKSFISTAVGLAIDKGLISLNDKIISFFPDDLPDSVGENLSKMRIKHLLTMSTGHAQDTTGSINSSDNWVKSFLSLPVEYEPGTHFLYNSGATYMLSAIVQKVTGQKVLDYLNPRLFEPLGIKDATWETCPRGINTGGWGLSVKTEDILRLGLLYLNKGIWNGKRLLPEKWAIEATSKHISTVGTNPNPDWVQGYCYQFWRCRHNIFRGDGAFGQYCIVMPDQDAVIAITSGLGDMQAVLDQIWTYILPGIQDSPLTENKTEQSILKDKLHNLRILPPKNQATAPIIRDISGKTYKIKGKKSDFDLSFKFTYDSCVIESRGNSVNESITFGVQSWVPGECDLMGDYKKINSALTWLDDNTLLCIIRFIEAPYYYKVVLKFDGNEILIDPKLNVSFGPTDKPILHGTMI